MSNKYQNCQLCALFQFVKNQNIKLLSYAKDNNLTNRTRN